jgi:IS5 family transposase
VLTNKLYSLYAPEVACLPKGKARKPYEFGVKVSITTTQKDGLVVGWHALDAWQPVRRSYAG